MIPADFSFYAVVRRIYKAFSPIVSKSVTSVYKFGALILLTKSTNIQNSSTPVRYNVARVFTNLPVKEVIGNTLQRNNSDRINCLERGSHSGENDKLCRPAAVGSSLFKVVSYVSMVVKPKHVGAF